MQLNERLRMKIVNAVLKHSFADKLLALAVDRQALAYKVYDSIVDQTTVSHLSEPWVTRNNTRFAVSSSMNVYGFDVTGKALNVPAKFRRDFGRNDWQFDHPTADRKIILPTGERSTFDTKLSAEFATKYREQQKKCETLCEEICQRRVEIRGVIGQTRSVPNLLKAWPEIKPFLPVADIDAPVKDLPATVGLNKALGLPV